MPKKNEKLYTSIDGTVYCYTFVTEGTDQNNDITLFWLLKEDESGTYCRKFPFNYGATPGEARRKELNSLGILLEHKRREYREIRGELSNIKKRIANLKRIIDA